MNQPSTDVRVVPCLIIESTGPGMRQQVGALLTNESLQTDRTLVEGFVTLGLVSFVPFANYKGLKPDGTIWVTKAL